MRKNNFAAGQKWHSLTLADSGQDYYFSMRKYDFLCDCGNIHEATPNNVSRGVVKHCAKCSAAKKSRERTTHGHSLKLKEKCKEEQKCYYTWQAMKRRCFNESENGFERYGGRGITVCDRWKDSYENFLEDMGLPPTMDHQIDRSDNDGNYEPGNCSWVDRTTNGRNKRNNNVITAFGKTQNLSAWAEETGIKRETIARRIKSGIPAEEALKPGDRINGANRVVLSPLGEFQTITDCAKAAGMSISGVHSRMNSPNYPDWNYKDMGS